MADKYVIIYVTIGPTIYESLQWIYIWNLMIYSIYNLGVYIHKSGLKISNNYARIVSYSTFSLQWFIIHLYLTINISFYVPVDYFYL